MKVGSGRLPKHDDTNDRVVENYSRTAFWILDEPVCTALKFSPNAEDSLNIRIGPHHVGVNYDSI